MKRKRRDACPSPLLDESPKRTKVQAQRKFAQGSNVNSPVITPIRELEAADLLPRANVLPEPVELLPMKRPNTEDFLTFLCFRGTPLLPPNLNFFNTASIVADGQVHEIKGDSPKNGPIDIAKCGGTSSEKPFIAFGVRKRADPIVISRQMDRKRRHALAIQALRRKYQEQKMAKIRALTISKLSEKTTNKTLVKTNTIQKTETVTKKNLTLQKTKVIATKHVKVTTQTLKTALESKVKPRMCLRSFRGRFVHKELPFRGKRLVPDTNKLNRLEKRQNRQENKVADNTSSRLTRSGNINIITSNIRRKQINKRILMSTTKSVVKPKLRSTTLKKTVISQRKAKQRMRLKEKQKDKPKEEPVQKVTTTKKTAKKEPVPSAKKPTENARNSVPKTSENVVKKEIKKNINIKKVINKKTNGTETKKNIDIKKTSEITERDIEGQKLKKELNKVVETTSKKVVTKKTENKNKDSLAQAKKTSPAEAKVKKPNTRKSSEEQEKIKIQKETKIRKVQVLKKAEQSKKSKVTKTKEKSKPAEDPKQEQVVQEKEKINEDKQKKPIEIKCKTEDQKGVKLVIEDKGKSDVDIVKEKKVVESKPEPTKNTDEPKPKEENKGRITRRTEELDSQKTAQRPSRKTKEAAAIYMELLSHKLVNEGKLDDDNLSIDSFPELPNVKKTEQRENELKAQVKTCKGSRTKEVIAVIKEEEIDDKKKNQEANDKKKDQEPNDKNKNQEANDKKKDEEEKKDNKEEGGRESPEIKPVLRRKYTPVLLDSDSDDEVLQEKIRKSAKPVQEEPRRQTRGLTQTLKKSDSDSDESFHIQIRVPRKKKLTRSKAKLSTASSDKKVESPVESVASVKDKKESSDSDESTTSDINLKSLQVKQKNKKLSRIKACKKPNANFSDSDEEPLSKLTTTKSCTGTEESKKNNNEVPEAKEVKPKRECAKRPQNYLPMLSSSEDEKEPYFHGFKEEPKKPKAFTDSIAPSLDLLGKETGRKAKVNMSNEQIEQWLKDSVLAGSGVAKENDAMLKFGERIPAEVELHPSPENVQQSVEKKPEAVPAPPINKPIEKPAKCEFKSLPGDRKLIFKKDKKDSVPNVNAFSPDNECSVYAFGEDVEEMISTPFRRPSRRPSSTATSRSEDESSKNDDLSKQGHFRKPPPQESSSQEDFRFFNVPQNPTKLTKSSKMEPKAPLPSYQGKRPPKLTIDKFPEPFEDGKYKIPSSPSASSSSSAKLYKRTNPKQKARGPEPLAPIYVSDFPKSSEPGKLVEAPVFHPTDQEFNDPLEYIERIRHKAEQFGICKIVPPSSFKPECKVSDDMRFTAYNQYVHKMLHRWGPNFKEFMAIRKYLATQNITLKHPPWIGGMEIDLPRLYQTVQSLGGLKEVIEKKKWPKVSECMKIPKSAQDRVTKLDDIYCKYLLPYDTLSVAEREKLFNEVETDWAKRESKSLLKAESKFEETTQDTTEDELDSDSEAEECIVKGRNMALNAFYRIARNTMSMHFKTTEPTPQEVEQEFWKYVTQKQNYICVHSASIDCGNWGYGFAVSKNSPFAKHPWNLKVLTNNSNSVLRSLGPVMGVTVPTLHVGMVFSACCWYRDPHGLPWIEYLHTGGSKIWYGIPNSACDLFHAALKKLVPNYCRNKEVWLPSDTAMIPPSLLMENNVSLCRAVQEPGQFIVVFPKVFTSCVSTGYVVSESVYFAPLYWLKMARSLFNDMKSSCEPSIFSLERLLLSIASDSRSTVEVLKVITPYIQDLVAQEKSRRNKIRGFGKIEEEKMSSPEAAGKKRKKVQVGEEGDFECEICRINLHASMVLDGQNDLAYCLEHAISLIEKDQKVMDSLKLRYIHDEEELGSLVEKINCFIDAKLQKKVPNKFAGMPTLLNK